MDILIQQSNVLKNMKKHYFNYKTKGIIPNNKKGILITGIRQVTLG